MSSVQDRSYFSLKTKKGKGSDRNGHERHFLMLKSHHSRGMKPENTKHSWGNQLAHAWAYSLQVRCHWIGRNVLDRDTRTCSKQMQNYNSSGKGKCTTGVALVLSSLVQNWMLALQTCKWLSYSSQISDNNTSSNYHTGICPNSGSRRGCH